MAQNGSKRLIKAQNGPKWLNIAHNGSKLLKIAQNGSNLLKIAHNGSKWVTMAQNKKGGKLPKAKLNLLNLKEPSSYYVRLSGNLPQMP